MEKIKFIGVLIVIVILFQIPFLTEHDDIYSTVNMILTVVIWIIGTKNINKDTTLKKVTIYGFIALWCILMILITYCMWGKYLRHFSIIDAGWQYSVLIVFIISKILSLEFIQDKINSESKYLVIIMIAMLIIGALIGYGIEYLENYKLDFDTLDTLVIVMYYINISTFSILLFSILKINEESKKFVILSTGICIVIIFIINIIPIQKINSIINSQEELCKIIDSSSHLYTYKNISSELGKYLPNEKIEMAYMKNKTWDYQQYYMINERLLSVCNSWLQDVNRKNFKNVLESVQSFPSQLNELIEAGKQACNARIISMVISSIIVCSMGVYLVLKKSEEYMEI